MAGELWLAQWEAAKEVAYGTAVASTRQMYFRPGSYLGVEYEPRLHKAARGTRENVVNLTLGPEKPAGQVILPVSAEILELLEIGIQGDVAAVGAGTTKTWTFKPSATLNSGTFRGHDGARPWRMDGVYAGKLNFKGSVEGENLLTADLFGQNLAQEALTGGLTARVPAVFEGWEAKLYIDAFAAAPGGTNIAAFLLDWDVAIDNAPQRHFTADNTQSMSSATLGEIGVEATLTVLASAAQALTEFNNWKAATKRVVRLEFGGNTLIGAGPDTEKITLDLAGGWTAVDLNQESNGVRAYQLKFAGVYDPTNIFSLQIIATTARATVW